MAVGPESEGSMRIRMATSREGLVTRAFRLPFVLLILLLLSRSTLAQSTAGRILGTLSDPSGAAVAGATVIVTDAQRGTTRTVTTDETGSYAVPDLQPGTYRIHVQAKGFKSVERPNLQIEVASDVRADFALQPGNVTEVLTVVEDVPLVNTTSATLGGTLSNKEINDLPLNGRNSENLLQLRPGVMRYPGGGFSTTSSNGLRAEDNAYFIEGLFNSEPYSGQAIVNGAGIAGDSATILPIDSIQEFNVQQNPPAEYGWKPGANVNVGLKSGTNTLHGSAYGFFRTTDLDARNFYNTVASGPKNPRNLKQFGGTVGGPIVKDKLFFFGGYEGQRYTVGNVQQLATPATVGLPNAGNCTYIASGDCVNRAIKALQDVHAGFLAGQIPMDVSAASMNIAGCTANATFTTVTCNGSGIPTNNGSSPSGPTTINYNLPHSPGAQHS